MSRNQRSTWTTEDKNGNAKQDEDKYGNAKQEKKIIEAS